jgi:ATP-dependent HslUV protease ATP-binding subunit HslU
VIEALAGKDARDQTREMFRKKLRKRRTGRHDDRAGGRRTGRPFPDRHGPRRRRDGQMQGQDLFGKAFGGRKTRKRMTVAESYDVLLGEEADKLLDDEAVKAAALEAVQENGIVFLDEIDKICARSETRGADVSREGVQRDLLPLIEGTTVSTKYGPVKTDHILFIASGAFHVAKPSDLLPELQGRLPIRVELSAPDRRRFRPHPDRNRQRPDAAIFRPDGTEEVTVTFTEDGIAALARIAAEVNRAVENIGARRLYTVLERVFEELSFTAPDRSARNGRGADFHRLCRNHARAGRHRRIRQWPVGRAALCPL